MIILDAIPNGVIEIRMPKLNNNDSAYVLLSWLVPDGHAVHDGDPVAEAETSKAVEELLATGSGLFEPVAKPGSECIPGQVIARLHVDEVSFRAGAAPEVKPAAVVDGPMVTAPAAALIDSLGISPEVVRGWGLAVVRRDDVERLTAAMVDEAEQLPVAAPAVDVVVTTLSRVQRGVGLAVSLSHGEIPAAFTVAEVDVTDALAAARVLTKANRALIGLAELTIAAIAARRAADAACFVALASDGRSTELRTGAHIGVTFDVGKGLFAPVVHDADRLALADLARALTEHRLAAMRGTFREADLQGANITLTLHTDPGIVFAMPIVFPGQACALSLASPRSVAVPDADGGFRARQLIHLGVAFDHRVVNGSQASALLRGVKELLESAEFLAAS